MRGLAMTPERGISSRLVAGALIALLHGLMVLALLKFAQAPDARDQAKPVDYIAFAFIAAPKTPVPVEKAAPPPVVAPSVRPRPAVIVVREVAPEPAPMTIVQEPPPSAEAQAAPAPERRLDMDSLRAAARLVDSERTPTAMGGRRESTQLQNMDDTALSRGIQRAKRPDCQTKYSGGTSLNVLALIPLAIETITDKGCKW